MTNTGDSIRSAHGSYIAQADQGSTAIVSVTHQAPLVSITAVSPPPPSCFTGRHSIRSAIREKLFDEDSSVVALVGMGGIGKTALAKQVAFELRENFPGGVFWGSLVDTNGDPLPILRSWALNCAYDLADNVDLNTTVSVLRGLLEQRNADLGLVLLVLDDIRGQWIVAANRISETRPANCSLIVTTRDENLAQALNATIFRMEMFSVTEALQLFSKLISDDEIAFSEDAISLVNILGYLPLAIELSGKKLTQLLRKPGYLLSDFVEMISTKASDTLRLRGHPGLVSSFEITYADLDDREQYLFRYLGVFAFGPILLSDIVGIMHCSNTSAKEEDEDDDFGKILDDFVQLSLLDWGDVAGTYVIHPLLWQYAHTLLESSMELEAAELAHTKYYAGFFDGHPTNSKAAFSQIEQRLTNFLLASKLSFGNRNYTQFLLLVSSLARIDGYLYLRGYWDEASELLANGYEFSKLLLDEEMEKEFLWHLGILRREQGNYGEAKHLLEALVEKHKQQDDRDSLPNSMFGLGYVHIYLAEYEQAEIVLMDAVRLAIQRDNIYAVGESLRGLGRVYLAQNNLEKARTYFCRSIPFVNRSNNVQGQIYALRGLGETLLLQKDVEAATLALSKALEIAELSEDKQAIGYTLRALGKLYVSTNHYVRAKEVYCQCIEICQKIGETGGLAASQCLLAGVLFELEEYDSAENFYRESQQLCDNLGLTRWFAMSQFGLAKIYYHQSDSDTAYRLANESLVLLQNLGHRNAEIVKNWLKGKF
ncbi:MAG: tetratricopeptide repeat protein [Caldilineaceae bacterium]|nr:tetratricopeptide repeat protein [Caldilineaceae bacterium]MBP8106132.1 tetratricopeptide repeat protein [Caldilineaceae bacterium]MBP8122290.1 tetratricopeptide repeat protein [Caldilineaceae bacterium]